MLLIKSRSNSCTSFLDRFPFTNSFHASSKFSIEMISSYVWANWILPVKPPPHGILPVLNKIKDAYLMWHGYYTELPKIHRYSFGYRIDSLFVELIEAVAAASFLSPQEKLPYVRAAIRKMDTLKIFLMILWETKSLNDKRYIHLSVKVNEIGKMLGGWQGQLIKNSPTKK